MRKRRLYAIVLLERSRVVFSLTVDDTARFPGNSRFHRRPAPAGDRGERLLSKNGAEHLLFARLQMD